MDKFIWLLLFLKYFFFNLLIFFSRWVDIISSEVWKKKYAKETQYFSRWFLFHIYISNIIILMYFFYNTYIYFRCIFFYLYIFILCSWALGIHGAACRASTPRPSKPTWRGLRRTSEHMQTGLSGRCFVFFLFLGHVFLWCI